MALEAASSSSSSPPQTLQKKYDVFISFRGEDTRVNFTSHLYKALCDKKIRTFMDDQELPKGDDISPSLLHAIEDSYISVVVFSENYATSRWCLDELVHILHCKRVQGQVVLPVFYKVDPSHVRKQTGVYEEAFERYETDPKVDQHKMELWKQALNDAANLSGYDSHNSRNDSLMIQNIVEDTLVKLNQKYPRADIKGLVGIDDNCTEVELLLRDAATIGIWGMGGIGKSTIAKTVLSRYSSHYEGSCFLENVREKSQKGLGELQREFLSRLLKEDVQDDDSSLLESRLSRMKVFVVLDDISTVDQFNCLVGKRFCQGSKILITTRDKHVLTQRVNEIYEVKRLDLHHSNELFNLTAFGTYEYMIGYEELVQRAVAYAKGIPLALKALGSYLCGRNEDVWKSALIKLEKHPHKDIQKVLRLSYDGLDEEEKKIFLDIAYFLKGELKEFIIYLLDKCGFKEAAIGIETLCEKALINVNDGLHVEMHDLIQEMGLQVVREEPIDDPESRSRLLDCEEIYDLFINNEGSRQVQGIKLDVSQIADIELEADTFKKMSNIRYLIFYSAFNLGTSHVHLPEGLKFLPYKLRYLEWYGFPLKYLPSTFSPEKLVKLSMPNSHLEKLWNGAQDFVSLLEIDLSGSEQLQELPNLSKCENLKVVKLRDCKRCHIHSSSLSFRSLVTLDLYGCVKLESLKSDSHSKYLQHIDVRHCCNLKEFSVSSDELRKLDLSSSGIVILHKSVWQSSKLEELDLYGLRFVDIPDKLSCLKSLTILRLFKCETIDDVKLRVLFDGMLFLEEVYLDHCCNITELPENTKNLSRLEFLSIWNCRRLYSLPELPPSTSIRADDCESLEIFPTWKASRGGIKSLSFMNCLRLNEESLHNIDVAADFMVQFGCKSRDALYSVDVPGSKVPMWFPYRIEGSIIEISMGHGASELRDFFCCMALGFPLEYEYKLKLTCTLYFNNRVFARSYRRVSVRTKSDHVFIWNSAHNRSNSHFIWNSVHTQSRHKVHGSLPHRHLQVVRSELFFQFTVEDDMSHDMSHLVTIKGCGIYPGGHSYPLRRMNYFYAG